MKLIKLLIILAVLGLGIAGMILLKKTGPESKRRKPPQMQVIVEAQTLQPSTGGVTIEGMGLVLPAREVVLKSQVSGRIVEVSPRLLEGLHVAEDELLARVETTDFEINVARAASALAMRDAEVAMEMGSQRVAKREWQLMNETASQVNGDPSLALREPQLKQAQAMQQSAKAELKQARINLARTEYKAPFNAVVLTRSVEVGTIVGVNAEIARLVSTDSYHIRVSIPESQVNFLEVPGALARIHLRGTETPLDGEVISLVSELDPDGHMARVIVEVKDPLALKPQNQDKPKLLLAAYVEVTLEGEPIQNSFEIPRRALRNGDVVWLMRDNQTLEIRPVEVAWKNRETVLLRSGVSAGEQLITSSLSLASDGMAVATADTAQPRPGGQGKGQGSGQPEGKPKKDAGLQNKSS